LGFVFEYLVVFITKNQKSDFNKSQNTHHHQKPIDKPLLLIEIPQPKNKHKYKRGKHQNNRQNQKKLPKKRCFQNGLLGITIILGDIITKERLGLLLYCIMIQKNFTLRVYHYNNRVVLQQKGCVMVKRILSLDLGITSIGYALLKEHENDRYALKDYGVSMFDKATDKDGNSKKLLHSASSSASNLVNLRKKRKKNLAKLFEEFGLGEKEYFLYQERQNIYKNKWELRAKKAFGEKLKIEELFSVLYAIAKHRGYKSLDTNDLLEELCVELNIPLEEEKSKKDNKGQAEDEKGKIKLALKTIENLKQHYPNKTVATIIYEEEIQKETPVFRNHDNYRYMIRREDINDEIQKIIASQVKFGLFEQDFKSDELSLKLIKTIDDQKESSNSEDLFARCEFYKEHKVSHQYSLLADIFKMYQAVSNITFNKNQQITKEQIQRIADDFLNKIKEGESIADIKYKDIRKILKLDESIKIFNKEDKNKDGKDLQLIKFHFVNNLSKFGDAFRAILDKPDRYAILKEIFDVVGFEKTPKSIYEKLKGKMDDKTIVEIIKHKTGSSLRLSSYAMVQFLPYFEEGMSLDMIKQTLNLNRNEDYSQFKKGIKYLSVSQFENDDNLPINNHPVKYAVSAVLRLVKHLHTAYGTFDEIRVESTRELSLNEEAKKEIDKANKALEKEIDDIVANEEYQKVAKHYGKNLRKYARKILMYEEQNRKDIYTDEGIEFGDIFTSKVDIDHIVPQSLGGLSVKHNLVLVHRDSNMQKSNQLPMNFINDAEKFKIRVEDLFRERKINWKKKINLLATTLDETFKDTFESKELRATSYIETLTAQILKRYYPFPHQTQNSREIRHIQGRATSNIRKLLKVKTKVRDTNVHHAIDALLIGLINNSWLQKLSNTFRENFGKIDDEARANIKKDIPIVKFHHVVPFHAKQ